MDAEVAASPEDAEAAAAAEQLAHRAVHSVLLLHDGRGLPRRNRHRAGGAAAKLAAGAAAAGDAGFLIVPLLGHVPGMEQAGEGRQEQGGKVEAGSSRGEASSQGRAVGGARRGDAAAGVDWGAVRSIAATAAFKGTLLEWLRQQVQEQVQEQAQEQGGQAAGSSSCSGAAMRKALAGRVLVATHNNAAYLYRQAWRCAVHGTSTAVTAHCAQHSTAQQPPACLC